MSVCACVSAVSKSGRYTCTSKLDIIPVLPEVKGHVVETSHLFASKDHQLLGLSHQAGAPPTGEDKNNCYGATQESRPGRRSVSSYLMVSSGARRSSTCCWGSSRSLSSSLTAPLWNRTTGSSPVTLWTLHTSDDTWRQPEQSLARIQFQ